MQYSSHSEILVKYRQDGHKIRQSFQKIYHTTAQSIQGTIFCYAMVL